MCVYVCEKEKVKHRGRERLLKYLGQENEFSYLPLWNVPASVTLFALKMSDKMQINQEHLTAVSLQSVSSRSRLSSS